MVTIVEAYQGSWINFGGFFTQFSRCQQNPRYFSPREWNYYVDLWTWRYLLGYRRDREELFKVFQWWYCLEAAFVLAYLPVSRIFHPHSFSAAWPRVYSVLYGLFYGKCCRNVDACACNRYQAAFSPPLRGLGTRLILYILNIEVITPQKVALHTVVLSHRQARRWRSDQTGRWCPWTSVFQRYGTGVSGVLLTSYIHLLYVPCTSGTWLLL